MSLPSPKAEEIIYEDSKLYFALARYPMSKGHCVVVWKENVPDLHLLERDNYEYLMNKVEDLRDVMIKVLNVEKIYLLYLDEANHVHWHLVPRYDKKGLVVLEGHHKKNEDYSLVSVIKEIL